MTSEWVCFGKVNLTGVPLLSVARVLVVEFYVIIATAVFCLLGLLYFSWYLRGWAFAV